MSYQEPPGCFTEEFKQQKLAAKRFGGGGPFPANLNDPPPLEVWPWSPSRFWPSFQNAFQPEQIMQRRGSYAPPEYPLGADLIAKGVPVLGKDGRVVPDGKLRGSL
jgi:hypothetical protein